MYHFVRQKIVKMDFWFVTFPHYSIFCTYIALENVGKAVGFGRFLFDELWTERVLERPEKFGGSLKLNFCVAMSKDSHQIWVIFFRKAVVTGQKRTNWPVIVQSPPAFIYLELKLFFLFTGTLHYFQQTLLLSIIK